MPNPVRGRLDTAWDVLTAAARAERAVTGERHPYEAAFHEPLPDYGREMAHIAAAEARAAGVPAPPGKPKRTFTRDLNGYPVRFEPCEVDYWLAEILRAALVLKGALEDFDVGDPAGACGCPFCKDDLDMAGYFAGCSWLAWDLACAAEGDLYHALGEHAKALADADADRRRIGAALRSDGVGVGEGEAE